MIKISKKKYTYSKNLYNNKKLNPYFTDYRFKRTIIKKDNSKISFMNYLISKISKKGFLQGIYENYLIRKYLNKLND